MIQKTTDTETTNTEMIVSIADIGRNPSQPRREFDHAELQLLSASIAEHELLQPIGIRRSGAGAEKPFELIWGERRLRATELAGHTTIRATLRESDPVKSLLMMGEENLNRKDWNPVERAEYLQRLNMRKEDGGAGLTHDEIAPLCGHNRTWVSRQISLLKLPEATLQRVISGELTVAVAVKLATYADTPIVLAALIDDMAKNPQFWETSVQYDHRVELIVKSISAIDEEPVDAHPGLSRGQQREQTREPICEQPQTTKIPALTKASPDHPMFRRFLPVVEPYRDSLNALTTLRNLIDALINQLVSTNGHAEESPTEDEPEAPAKPTRPRRGSYHKRGKGPRAGEHKRLAVQRESRSGAS